MGSVYKNEKEKSFKPVDVSVSSDVKFVLAGVKAAKNISAKVRESVVGDISDALNCDPQELEFLFESEPDEDPTIYDFPDSERRRAVLEISKIAAE